MKKVISHQEKLEFYKKYNSPEFIKELSQDEEKFKVIGFWGLTSMTLLTVILLSFSYWFGFLMFPTVSFPFCMMAASFFSYKKKVANLTKNITYKDFIEMYKNGEWQQIAKEINTASQEISEKPKYYKPSIMTEIKNHGCSYVDEDKLLHKNDHDDLSV